jgi:hypothetical protein
MMKRNLAFKPISIIALQEEARKNEFIPNRFVREKIEIASRQLEMPRAFGFLEAKEEKIGHHV